MPASRATWIDFAERLARPVLGHLARGELRAAMPVETAPGVPTADRAPCTHLEAVGRTLMGLAPWLELGPDDTAEGRLRGELAELARAGLDRGTDPASPDCLNFAEGRQPLVDAAFLAQSLLRAPRMLWEPLPPAVRARVLDALAATRGVEPGNNNWVLFASMVEAARLRFGAPIDRARLERGLRLHQEWYAGDGAYGDGPEFHWDYYNAYVIQPMLLDVLDVIGDEPAWRDFVPVARARARRYAAIQERLVAPDGTFPVLGRSIAYRCGALQVLAQMALRRDLPEGVSPARARGALTGAITRTLGAPGTFDAAGWLRIGLAGAQPGLAERYISTGSLYLCSAAFLPLGLPDTDPFWTAPAEPGTWATAWSGQDLPADHALKE